MNTSKPGSRRKYLLIGLVIVILAAAALFIAAPQPTIFSAASMPVTCVYSIKIVAFDDANNNGVQDADEVGIAGVEVTLQHSLPEDAALEKTTTDATGSATLNADKYCPIDDMMTVSAALPSGYKASTPIVFGPYPVPEFTNASMTQVAENPIPAVLYVGLQKG